MFDFNFAIPEFPWFLFRKKPTVLLIEDDPTAAKLITDAATEEGFEVVQVAHGREALGVLADNGKKYVFVMLDVNLPGLSGWTIRRTIAQRWPKLKVCMMSAAPESFLRAPVGEMVSTLVKGHSYYELFRELKRTIA